MRLIPFIILYVQACLILAIWLVLGIYNNVNSRNDAPAEISNQPSVITQAAGDKQRGGGKMKLSTSTVRQMHFLIYFGNIFQILKLCQSNPYK